MKFTKESLDLETGITKEWLITNGIGGFASSTIIGANTRKYHGLLVAPLNPPANRYVILSKLDEAIEIRGKRYDLYTNICQSYISHGYQYQETFEKDYYPTFQYKVQGIEIEKSIFFTCIPAAKSGIFAGVILGIGRAIGETMAVSMVAGNSAIFPDSIISQVRTLTANVIMEMSYATGLHKEALIATGAVLFVFILIINLAFSLLKKTSDRKEKQEKKRKKAEKNLISDKNGGNVS